PVAARADDHRLAGRANRFDYRPAEVTRLGNRIPGSVAPGDEPQVRAIDAEEEGALRAQDADRFVERGAGLLLRVQRRRGGQADLEQGVEVLLETPGARLDGGLERRLAGGGGREIGPDACGAVHPAVLSRQRVSVACC